MANILLVEDDELLRQVLKDLLKKKGHNVTEAPNGKVAIDFIVTKDFQVVISDIQMPVLNGIELLAWSMKNKPLPFIIMTGFSTLLETHSAYDLGAKEFITKPFNNNELLALVSKLTGEKDGFLVVETITEYCKIAIDEFVFGKKVEFDLYVKLSETKYVKISNEGEELPKDRILHYKMKGVKNLYITKEAFTRLIDFNLNIANKMSENKEISREKKLNFIKYTGKLFWRRLT